LRHSFANVPAASGIGLPIIGKILGQTHPNAMPISRAIQ
jgi:hypothetical protein